MADAFQFAAHYAVCPTSGPTYMSVIPLITGSATVHSGIKGMYVGPLVWQTAECAANGNASATF